MDVTLKLRRALSVPPHVICQNWFFNYCVDWNDFDQGNDTVLPRAVPKSVENTMQGARSHPCMMAGHVGLSEGGLYCVKG